MSAGVLTEEEVEGIRTGRIADPTVGQVAALAAVFGVEPSYLVDRGKEPSVLDEEVDGRPGRRDRATPYSGRAPACPRGRSGSSSG